MGLFNKKPNKNKVYSCKEAMDFISKNPNYDVIETTGGFHIICEEEARKQINRHKQRHCFEREISGNSEYRGIGFKNDNSKEQSRIQREVDFIR